MGKFKDYVIISDYDGTLVGKDLQQIPRNVTAIQNFTAQGGRFGIATGRSTEFVRPLIEKLGVNFPCVTYNGGVVYDYHKKIVIYEELLPLELSYLLCSKIQENFPKLGILAISNSPNILEDEEILIELGLGLRTMDNFTPVNLWRENKAPWYKVLFSAPEKELLNVLEYAQGFDCPEVRFVQSGDVLVELLPAKANKATALKKTLKEKDISHHKVIAIGDYFNDLEMLAYAGLGVTLNTAPKEIQKIADYVGGSLEKGIVAEVIEQLEKTIS